MIYNTRKQTKRNTQDKEKHPDSATQKLNPRRPQRKRPATKKKKKNTQHARPTEPRHNPQTELNNKETGGVINTWMDRSTVVKQSSYPERNPISLSFISECILQHNQSIFYAMILSQLLPLLYHYQPSSPELSPPLKLFFSQTLSHPLPF